MDLSDLASSILKRSRKAIARGISLSERGDPQALELLDLLYPHTGGAQILGVTGAPGTGKSTLVGALAQAYRRLGRRVGILAVDPSSPFTGGAILGDRIRMARPSADPEVFIRSMASKSELGGLAPSTFAALQILDAAGYERILIETVGTGQAEIDIVQLAHTTLVVLVPGLGDEIQVFKAGIMEIADLYVINKADREGAGRLEQSIASLLDLADAGGPRPAIVKTSALREEGIEPLIEGIDEHARSLAEQGGRRLRQRTERLLRKLLQEQLTRLWIVPLQRSGELEGWVDRIVERRVSPMRAAHELARGVPGRSGP